jgi:prepilin peptidase CpaA
VNLIASISLHLTASTLYPLSWEVFIFPVGFIVVGFFLYLMKVMGAGDSKFLASLFLIIPLEFHLMFFEKLIISSIVTGTTLFLYRILINGSKLRSFLLAGHWEGVREILKSRFSYAPVVFLAWVILGFRIWN